jgi:hypothetical protein
MFGVISTTKHNFQTAAYTNTSFNGKAHLRPTILLSYRKIHYTNRKYATLSSHYSEKNGSKIIKDE